MPDVRDAFRRMRGRRRTYSDGQHAPAELGRSPIGGGQDPESIWFREHYDRAAGEVVEMLESAGKQLSGSAVADVGCGDGIMALGVMNRARPSRLVGYDLHPPDRDRLARAAMREGVVWDDPGALQFVRSEPVHIPAEANTFDVVYTWSAFEHVADPLGLLCEVSRILRPDGLLMLQLWPFYHSERGSHLWDWFPAGFHHLSQAAHEIESHMAQSDAKDATMTEHMIGEFRTLNRMTVDELQRCLLGAGFSVRVLEFMTHRVAIPEALARYSLTDLGIAGIKLVAQPTR